MSTLTCTNTNQTLCCLNMTHLPCLIRFLHGRLFDVEDVAGQVAMNNSAPQGGGGVIMWSGRTPRLAVLCAPGYEGIWTSCVACGIGTYKNSSGTPPCLQCESGSYATSTAQSSCAKCGIGQYSTEAGATSQSTCLSCPRDTSTLATGAPSSEYCVCEPGFVTGLDGEIFCF
jgi:hypothetical protein